MHVNLSQDLQTQPLLKSPPTEKKGMVPLTEEVEEERNGVVDDPWGVRHVFPDHFLICERGCQKSTSLRGVVKSQLFERGCQKSTSLRGVAVDDHHQCLSPLALTIGLNR